MSRVDEYLAADAPTAVRDLAQVRKVQLQADMPAEPVIRPCPNPSCTGHMITGCI